MPPTSAWSINYHDGSGNAYRIWQDGDVVRFEYSPVTPEMSSTGHYSGGEPASGTLTEAEVRELRERVDALARDTSLHTTSRDKGTGWFATTTPSGTETFIVNRVEPLLELDAMLARLRTPAPR